MRCAPLRILFLMRVNTNIYPTLMVTEITSPSIRLTTNGNKCTLPELEKIEAIVLTVAKQQEGNVSRWQLVDVITRPCLQEHCSRQGECCPKSVRRLGTSCLAKPSISVRRARQRHGQQLHYLSATLYITLLATLCSDFLRSVIIAAQKLVET